jgi:hypothetical protein
MAAVDTPHTSRASAPPPTVASAGSYRGPVPSVRVGEDAFASEATVDAWVRGGAATRAGGLLTVHDGRRYMLRDAVRVLGRRNGDTDPYGFTGRVDAIRDFIRRGASISTDALRLGPAVYDIEYGFIAVTMGTVPPAQG